jgi:hypothetical protein
MKLTSIAALTATAIFASTMVSGADVADGPRLNVDGSRHPHLAAAQDLSRKAFYKILEARQANDWDPNGHLARALDMLVTVNNEIAAGVSNR